MYKHYKLMLKNNIHVFILFGLLLFVGCKETNWQENYREREKSPFGTFIVYNEMSELLDGEEVTYLKSNIDDYLKENYVAGADSFSNYICIKNTAPKLNDKGIDQLFEFVGDGNTAFLALNTFPNYLKERLEFTTKTRDSLAYSSRELINLKGNFTLLHQKFKDNKTLFDRNIKGNYFLDYNAQSTVVLGTLAVDSIQKPNFIKTHYKQGVFYLHSQPICFTNYYLLKEQVNYVSNVFSYVPSRKTIWDPQVRKSLNSNSTDDDKDSVFKFFLENPSLKWSLYLGMGSLLLFIMFNARRKQRPIPIQNKLVNNTVAFTHTIANLYLKAEDPKNLVDKKITYFLERIRTQLLLDTSNLNENFIEKLALKSGNKIASTRYLIKTIRGLSGRSECTNDELQRLNSLIEIFLKQKKHGRSK